VPLGANILRIAVPHSEFAEGPHRLGTTPQPGVRTPRETVAAVFDLVALYRRTWYVLNELKSLLDY